MMNKFKKFLAMSLVLSFSLSGFSFLRAEESGSETERILLLDTELIDVPTAGIVDYYGLGLKTRFFSEGGVLTYLNFGVLPRLNLGASATVERLVGNETPVRLVRPEIQVKFRFYDGSLYIPAFAVGYDGQGHYYNASTKRFSEQRRGLYLTASHEIIIPNLFIHPGVNFSDFESEDIFVYLAANLTIEDIVGLMAEWDHIQNIDDSVVNLGMRFYVTPFFHFDFAIRAVGKSDNFDDGAKHRSERIVVLRYHTTF